MINIKPYLSICLLSLLDFCKVSWYYKEKLPFHNFLKDAKYEDSVCPLIHVIKCSEKCARRDWPERVHYISIKHAPYVTRVHCWDITHAAYVIGTSARNSRFYKRSKKACSSSIADLYKHLGIFKNTRKVRETLAFGSCLSTLL